jgi:hypothetical protein
MLFRFIFFCILSNALALGTLAQGRVSNVRLRPLNQQAIEVLYDLRNSQPTDSVYLRLQRRNGKLIVPSRAYVSGDTGQNQRDGRDHRIVWNMRRNGYTIREEVRALVLVKQLGLAGTTPGIDTPATPAEEPVAKRTRPRKQPNPDDLEAQPDTASGSTRPYRGPGWALLSALAPGIGNAFVQTPKPKLGLRPLVTVAAYGLLIYGAGQQGEAAQAYSNYELSGSAELGEPFYQKANEAHQRYYIATRAAAAIWLTDIVLTTIRGIKNQRTGRNAPSPVSVNLSYQTNVPVAVVRYTF